MVGIQGTGNMRKVCSEELPAGSRGEPGGA